MAQGTERESRGWSRDGWTTKLRQSDGQRFAFMDEPDDWSGNQIVPDGWAIDGSATKQPWWNTISAKVIPMKPQRGLFGFLSGAYRDAKRSLRNAEARWNGPVAMLMVPDTEASGGWFARPVRIADLGKDQTELGRDMDAALTDGDITLAESLRCAFMAVSGWTDTQ